MEFTRNKLLLLFIDLSMLKVYLFEGSIVKVEKEGGILIGWFGMYFLYWDV